MNPLRLATGIILLILGCLATGFILGWFTRAHAHSHYNDWRRPDGKGSCCSNLDCKPVSYRQAGIGFEIWIAEIGEWHVVPPNSILPFTSPDAGAHACYIMSWGFGLPKRTPTIWCVALPLTQ